MNLRNEFAIYIVNFFLIGLLMHNVGGYLKLAQFNHWSQVIWNYVLYIAPVAYFLRDFDIFHQYTYGVLALSIIEVYGYATNNSYIYPNNVLDKIFGERNFALLMTITLPLVIPVGNYICQKIEFFFGFEQDE
jgi:hypothetical protein